MKFRVNMADSDEQFFCSSQQNLLAGMKAFMPGAPILSLIPVGCRGGGCGVCRIRILAGECDLKKMSCKHVSPEERDEGVALACRVYPRSDMVIEAMPAAGQAL